MFYRIAGFVERWVGCCVAGLVGVFVKFRVGVPVEARNGARVGRLVGRLVGCLVGCLGGCLVGVLVESRAESPVEARFEYAEARFEKVPFHFAS